MPKIHWSYPPLLLLPKEITKDGRLYPVNGSPVTEINASTHRKGVKSLSLSKDKQILTLKTVVYSDDSDHEVDFTRIEVYTIVNGKLTVNKTSTETKAESWEVKGVFTKIK